VRLDALICFLGNTTWRASFVSGSEELINGIREALFTHIGTSMSTIHQSSSNRAYALYYFKKSNLIKIFNYFYNKESLEKGLFLKRKYELFLKCYDRCAKKTMPE